MRTTVSIPDDLLQQVKRVAAGRRRTLSELVEDGLRMVLARQDDRSSIPPALPVFGGSGLKPGVDLEDKEGLAALLDEPHRDAAR